MHLPRLLVVAHAPSPNTEALRRAVAAGAGEIAEVDTVVLGPFETGPADVLASFFNDTATTDMYTRTPTLSLHDPLPI